MKCAIVGLGVLLLCVSPLQAVETGLTVDNGGLVGTGAWGAGPAVFDWGVSQGTAGMWDYWYELTVPTGAVSHLIIEVSDADPGPAFTGENLLDSDHSWEIDTYDGTDGSSNPGMPAGLYGVKFDTGNDGTTARISFSSDRVPVWGSFYAKNGFDQSSEEWNAIWNSGLSGGSDFILVPDSITSVPAPGAILLGSIGVGLVGWFRRKKMV